jgi:hypothetical protein
MGKKVNRAIVLMMAISLLLGSVTAYAAENQDVRRRTDPRLYRRRTAVS